MNEQTQKAINTLIELYGQAPWMTNPKSGQVYEKIIEQWDDSLKDYAPEQVVAACRRVWKYRLKTFPQLGHILAELTDIEPKNEPEDKPRETGGGCWQEWRDFVRNTVANGYNGRQCLTTDLIDALHRALDEIDVEFPRAPFEPMRSASELVAIGRNNKNAFWPKVYRALSAIVEKRPVIVHILNDGRTYKIPSDFDPNNTRRKCA